MSRCACAQDAALDVGQPRGKGSELTFARARIEQIKQLRAGEYCIWMAGWSKPGGGHAITLLVENVDNTTYALVVCNTGSGAQYHIQPPEGAGPKPKRFTQMRLEVGLERLTDPAMHHLLWRQWAFPHKAHGAKVLYEVILYVCGDRTHGRHPTARMPCCSRRGFRTRAARTSSGRARSSRHATRQRRRMRQRARAAPRARCTRGAVVPLARRAHRWRRCSARYARL